MREDTEGKRAWWWGQVLELVLIGGGYVTLLLAVLQHSHDHNPDGSIWHYHKQNVYY